MNIKGIIFDFGFTLAYFKDVSVEKYFNCFKRGLKKSVDFLIKSNILINDYDLIQNFLKTFMKTRNNFFKQSITTKTEFPTTFIFQNVLEQLIDQNKINLLTENYYKELANLYHSYEEEEWIPFDETRDTLRKISELKDVKIALLSNHPHHPTIMRILKKYDLTQFFNAIVTSAKFGKRKPHLEIFHYTLKKMGLEINEAEFCLMCGDEYSDIVGGYNVGLQTILCERLYKFPFEKEITIPNF
ncbi:MAG: HAD family hydrolase, partial [Promethearchaeota archaeon]